MASGYSDLSEIRKDGRSFGSYPKPPKINLLNERPRRESLVEQELSNVIVRPPAFDYVQQPQQQAQGQRALQQVGSPGQASNSQRSQQQYHTILTRTSSSTSNPYNDQLQAQGYPGPSTMNQVGQPQYFDPYNSRSASTSSGYQAAVPQRESVRTTTVITRTDNIGSGNQRSVSSLHDHLADELAEKEAKLRREIAYLNLYSNPWSRPKQIREPRREPAPKVVRSDHRWLKECPSGTTSRSVSRASSARSNTEADLLEKAAQLLQDVEDLERKPLTSQQILIEGSAKRPQTSQPLDSSSQAGSVHTAIIKVPDKEVDNKSPLPFAFDNFSTLGVRGNIASVGATEPEKPYPPIFPTIKKTPSPTGRRY